ncbi:MAG TPA: bifunctional homocysteine S-methyltransferase/methylenetetrahydrofolate reductase [Chloroflexota bacterium]|nr:bifunctional homocysteine S-methyltransferase/methylenetetrahydrofolate reductase [Chloroflexota bacterium]
MQHPFVTRLEAGPAILADGAMGTQLYARGVALDDCFDLQNLERPAVVEEIHRDYISAGAELIETNTFGANRMKLAAFGLEDRTREINQRGARLARHAREVAGQPVFVAGSVGPMGRPLQPFGSMTARATREVFGEQIDALLEGGIDLLLLETFGDLNELIEAVRAARELTDLPIAAAMTFGEDLRTPTGHDPETVAQALATADVNVIGANCSVGPNGILAVAERLLAAGARKVSAMPNAGWPAQVGERVMYLSSPHYMAEHARRMVDLGVSIVGGCCGTTPVHIRVMKGALELSAPGARIEVVTADAEVEAPQPAPTDASLLAGKLGSRRVVSVEIRPPRGANPAKALEGARVLKEAGVDAVNVLDSAMSRVRMSALATAVLIRRQVGVETILHFTTRDRNLMAIQSDLIGGHALGVRNVLALTGDPPSMGDYAHSKAVYDVDSIGLIRIIKQLNEGKDIAGNSIGTPTRFMVGCALNPTAEDLEYELGRFREKLVAGADFVMTQPVYDSALFQRVLDAVSPVDVPILMGVLPLQSFQHALFLHNELPGVKLTGEALGRMEEAGPDGVRVGLEMARHMIEQCGPLTAGVYIMPSFGRYEAAAQLVVDILEPV